jgi:hypothetical protein
MYNENQYETEKEIKNELKEKRGLCTRLYTFRVCTKFEKRLSVFSRLAKR